jgi:hypothetical protein
MFRAVEGVDILLYDRLTTELEAVAAEAWGCGGTKMLSFGIMQEQYCSCPLARAHAPPCG